MIDECILKIIFCHLLGDYVLQSDYIATTKGKNLYHLIVHSFLYAVPFYFIFGYDYKIYIIIISHIIIDSLKARYKVVDYMTDQIFHYFIALIYLTI
jgi:hypothetical protein